MKIRADEKLNILKCAGICGLCAFCCFIYYIICDGGAFTLCDDFNAQQIPFTIALHKAISGGLGGWTWSSDLGASIILSYSFYELGSPFFWLSTLFPADAFPFVVGWMYMLKYTVAGVTAYIFLRRYVRNPAAAMAGALLYAFSGFQSVNIEFYHFHDVVALFPLLLIGLERMMDNEDEYLLFVFAVFINCLTNYYFFVSEVIFLVIYFLFIHTDGGLRSAARRAVRCILCGVWGVAMAAVLFLPNAVYMLNTTRLSNNAAYMSLIAEPWKLIFTARGFLFPGGAMNDWCCIKDMDWSSADCYLPMVCIAPTLAYMLKRRDRLSWLVAVLVVISFMPKLNSAFVLFTDSYFRWWFMLCLLMALCTAKVMDEAGDYPLGFACGLNGAAIVVLYCAVIWAERYYTDYSVIFDFERLTFWTCLASAGTALTYFLLRSGRKALERTVAGICVFAVVSTFITVGVYRRHGYDNYINDLTLGCELETIDDQYRYNVTANPYSIPGGASGMLVFSSTRATGSVEFDSLFDYYYSCLSLNKNEYPGLTELMGGKYCLTADPGSAQPVREYDYGDGRVYVAENAACPIGYAVEGYILTYELKALPVEKRGIALLYAAVVEAEDSGKITGAEHTEISSIDTAASISDIVAQNTAAGVANFERDQRGFRCTTDYDTDRAVYFSVPNDRGWTAYIDGEEQQIISSGGMMLLNVPAGEHSIEFSYVTPYCREGLLISAAAVSTFAAAVIRRRINRRE